MSKARELGALTGLRFYAALHVVLFHNLYLFGDGIGNLPTIFLSFVQKGESAVSFFFILSGFILTHAYKDRLSESRKAYFVARFAKIYPLYVLGFLLDVPRVTSYFFSSLDFVTASFKWSVSALFYGLMLQSWFPSITSVWNSPAWSLSCEAFFYLSFVYLMPFVLRSSKKIILLIICYLLPIFIFALMRQIVSLEDPFFVLFFRSFPLLRLFEFIMGILAYSFYMTKNPLRDWMETQRSWLFWLCLSLSVLTTTFLKHFPVLLFSQVLIAPLFIVMIITAAFENFKGDFLFTAKPIYRLGQASYAIYILHQPIKIYFEYFLKPSFFTGCLYFAGFIVICLFLYSWFEKPLQKKLNLFFMPSKARP